MTFAFDVFKSKRRINSQSNEKRPCPVKTLPAFSRHPDGGGDCGDPTGSSGRSDGATIQIHKNLIAMKKTYVIIMALCIAATAEAQENKKTKTGWNFGPLPAVSYNSDLGFQYGALCDIFYYGDGSTFPHYMHKFNVEVSWYTKGSGTFHLFYDSKYLIRNTRLTFAATYMPNKMSGFYGFNGFSSPYDDGAGAAFYAMNRNMLRVLADFQGNITDRIGWAAGVSFWNYKTGHVGLDKYRDEVTLYDLYVGSGIIRPEEAAGGAQIEAKAGLVYDTRDHEAAPSRGIWAEAVLYGSPDIIERTDNAYLKLSAQFRHYVTLLENRLTFAYRLAYQGTLAGTAPYYIEQNIATLYLRQIRSEGLGGLNTVRGILLGRIVGDGYVWGNFELRCRLFDFRLFGQDWYAAVNPFFDAGMIVQPYRLEEMKAVSGSEAAPVYSGRKEKPHMSAGIGAKVVMNRNFIVSCEWGKPFDRQDGKSGMNIGLNYIF